MDNFKTFFETSRDDRALDKIGKMVNMRMVVLLTRENGYGPYLVKIVSYLEFMQMSNRIFAKDPEYNVIVKSGPYMDDGKEMFIRSVIANGLDVDWEHISDDVVKKVETQGRSLVWVKANTDKNGNITHCVAYTK